MLPLRVPRRSPRRREGLVLESLSPKRLNALPEWGPLRVEGGTGEVPGEEGRVWAQTPSSREGSEVPQFRTRLCHRLCLSILICIRA